MTEHSQPLLILENVTLQLRRGRQKKTLLEKVSFSLKQGERWGIIGESGAGKSMMMYAIIAFLDTKKTELTGSIRYRNSDGTYTDILKLRPKERRRYVSRMVSIILQDSINALNPFERIEMQWGETIQHHHGKMDCRLLRSYMLKQLVCVGLKPDEDILIKYPGQLSGGMRQRIAIAMAIESEAPFLIADEPTTSLDTINQRKIVELIKKICDDRALELIYISHNLGLIKDVCTHVAVMYKGRIIEQGLCEDIFSHPKDEYARILMGETEKLSRFYHQFLNDTLAQEMGFRNER